MFGSCERDVEPSIFLNIYRMSELSLASRELHFLMEWVGTEDYAYLTVLYVPRICKFGVSGLVGMAPAGVHKRAIYRGGNELVGYPVLVWNM